MPLRHDWTLDELKALYELPLFELISKAHHLHVRFHRIGEVQVCRLISIKTGGCQEDCKYCSQSSRYTTSVKPQPLMQLEDVLEQAKAAKKEGVTRVCLGAAWREVREGKAFETILQMIRGIASLGLETCCTLGMLTDDQAARLKKSGLYAYNHNLDTSEKHYKTVITTRSYQDRIDTLNCVEKAQLTLCTGGILGLGESFEDRLELLLTLAKRNPHPESVPINRLCPIPGTPLENQPPVSFWDMLRILAIARLLLPKSMIRLSAGRREMSQEEQALAFFAGANSIFEGDKLLTTPNKPSQDDRRMFQLLGLKQRPAFAKDLFR